MIKTEASFSEQDIKDMFLRKFYNVLMRQQHGKGKNWRQREIKDLYIVLNFVGHRKIRNIQKENPPASDVVKPWMCLLQEFVIGLDVGTTTVRSFLYNGKGTVVVKFRTDFISGFLCNRPDIKFYKQKQTLKRFN